MSNARMNENEFFNAGLRRAQAGDYPGALIGLRLAQGLGADSAELHRLIGKVYVHLGELEQAEYSFRRAQAIDPRDSAAALCLDRLHRFRLTRRALTAVVLPATAAAIGLALWFPWEAYRRLDAAVASISAPIAPAVGTNSGITLPTTTHPQAPNPEPCPPVTALPAFESRYREALGVAFAGDLKQALSLLRPLSAEEYAGRPLAGNVHFWMGRCLYELGEAREALDHFEIVLKRYPGSPKGGEAAADAARCRGKLKARVDDARER